MKEGLAGSVKRLGIRYERKRGVKDGFKVSGLNYGEYTVGIHGDGKGSKRSRESSFWDIMSWDAVEYYSAIKKSRVMCFIATWMELEGIVLSEITQEWKIKYHNHMFSLLSKS